MPRRKAKRIFIGADPHCGSCVGLTHPDYQWKQVGRGHTIVAKRRNKFANLQSEAWDKFVALTEPLKPFDAQFWVGDIIDGKGHRSGGTEQVDGNLDTQAEMWVCCAEQIAAPKVIAVYGTAYHTADGGQDWEDVAVEMLKPTCKEIHLGSHEWPEVNGLVFDLKHKVGSSSVPYGRLTPLEKEKAWNDLWAKRDWQPQADIIVRAHVHYFKYGGDVEGLRLTTPALQAMGTKFGSRICTGVVDWGFVVFDVEPDGSWTWEYYCPELTTQKARTTAI